MEWTWRWRITERGRFSWKIRRKRAQSLLCKNTIFVIYIIHIHGTYRKVRGNILFTRSTVEDSPTVSFPDT